MFSIDFSEMKVVDGKLEIHGMVYADREYKFLIKNLVLEDKDGKFVIEYDMDTEEKIENEKIIKFIENKLSKKIGEILKLSLDNFNIEINRKMRENNIKVFYKKPNKIEKRGFTYAYKIDGDDILYSIAICHPKDHFNKKVGKAIAVSRFLNGEYKRMKLDGEYKQMKKTSFFDFEKNVFL